MHLLFASSLGRDVWALGCTLGELLLSGAPLFAPASELGSFDDDDDECDPASDRLNDEQRQLLALFESLGTVSHPTTSLRMRYCASDSILANRSHLGTTCAP